MADYFWVFSMTIEVLNTIKRVSRGWEYKAKFKFNGKWIPVIGQVEDSKTEEQIKKRIIEKVKQQAIRYKKQNKLEQTKTLSIDNIFKIVI